MAEPFDAIPLTINVVASFVGQNHMRPDDVPGFIASVHEAIAKLQPSADVTEAAEQTVPEATPAVTVRKSLADPDVILSLIDGKPYKSLKRHLGRHGLTPATYRERYGLKADYPMVAPNYSAARSATAKALGLGRKALQKVEQAVGIEPAAEAPKPRRGRKPKTPAQAAS